MAETVHISIPVTPATPFINVLNGTDHPGGGSIYNNHSSITIELVFVATAAAATPSNLKGIPLPPKQMFPVGGLAVGEFFHARLPAGTNATVNAVQLIVMR